MKKSTGRIKRTLSLFLVVLMSIESFAAVVSDNDGAAFITKAEFDSLKNDFQSQINRYNESIDNKIDGAIAAYLAGAQMGQKLKVECVAAKYFSFPIAASNNGRYIRKSKDTSIGYDIVLTRRDGRRGDPTTKAYTQAFDFQARSVWTLSELLDKGMISSINAYGNEWDGNTKVWISGPEYVESLNSYEIKKDGDLSWISGKVRDGHFYATGAFYNANLQLSSSAAHEGYGQKYETIRLDAVGALAATGNGYWVNTGSGKTYYLGETNWFQDETLKYVNNDTIGIPGGAGWYFPADRISEITNVNQFLANDGSSIIDEGIYALGTSTYTINLINRIWTVNKPRAGLNEIAIDENNEFNIGIDTGGTVDRLNFKCDARPEMMGLPEVTNPFSTEAYSYTPRTNVYVKKINWKKIWWPIWYPCSGVNDLQVDNESDIENRGSLYAKYINYTIEDKGTYNITQGVPICKLERSGNASFTLNFADANTRNYVLDINTTSSLPRRGKICFAKNNPHNGVDAWMANENELLEFTINNAQTTNKIAEIDFNGKPIQISINNLDGNDVIFLNWCAADSSNNYVCHGILDSISNLLVQYD